MEATDVHPLTDFLRNHKAHMARIKATKNAEILTVHGRPELVLLGADSYQHLLDRLKHMEAISAIRQDFARSRQTDSSIDAVTDKELERRRNAVRELMAETERLGLYK